MFRVQFETADGIKMYKRVARLDREIIRVCMRILRLNGIDREGYIPDLTPMIKRKYVLWGRKTNGTYVYLEDL